MRVGQRSHERHYLERLSSRTGRHDRSMYTEEDDKEAVRMSIDRELQGRREARGEKEGEEKAGGDNEQGRSRNPK